jgi:hypothetical protein
MNSDILQTHRVIGIRSALRQMKEAGLISKTVCFPADAVEELKRTQLKADGATRHRKVRKDASIVAATRMIEKLFGLPKSSVKLCYPSGRKARSDSTIGALQKNWNA